VAISRIGGTPAEIRNNADVVRAYLGTQRLG
jgi:ABC-type branched-subunit amino acid transport system ATPase component